MLKHIVGNLPHDLVGKVQSVGNWNHFLLRYLTFQDAEVFDFDIFIFDNGMRIEE